MGEICIVTLPRLQGKQEGERLKTVVATIDEVAADGDGSRNSLDVGLLEKELLHLLGGTAR